MVIALSAALYFQIAVIHHTNSSGGKILAKVAALSELSKDKSLGR
jgi:hypothetical protein